MEKAGRRLHGSDRSTEKSLALQEVISSLHAASNIKEVMQHINHGIVQVLGYNGLTVSLLDEDRKAFKWSILHTKKKLKTLSNVKSIFGAETPIERHHSKFGDRLLDGKLYVTHSFREITETTISKVTTCSAIQKAMKTKTFVSVPLVDKGEVLGCIIVATSKRKVTEKETELLTAFGAEAGASVRRIELAKRSPSEVLTAMQKITALMQSTLELEAIRRESIDLQRVTSSIQITQGLDQIGQQLAEGIIKETVYDASAIFLLNEDEEVFRLAAIAPTPEVFPFVEKILGYKPTEFTILANGNHSETVRKILEGEVVATHDLYEIVAPRLSKVACSTLQGFVKAKSILVVPMIARGKVVGAFLVTTQQEQISERRKELLVGFANQAASLVENAYLLDIEGKEQQRSALLLAISHEFKVPLTSIKTMVSLLTEELKGDSQSPPAKMVDNIRRSSSKMERRLAELLDFAKMQTATIKLQLQPTNVKAIIEEAVSLCLPFRISKKQILDVDVPDSLPQVVLDQLRFERIITNLLTNASKFTPAGGKIRLRARERDGNLTVEVTDSGVGIPKSEVGWIFMPYYRGTASEPSSTGLGLGLAIVKQLVELHQGKVWVKSKPGKGSTFTFSLPIRNSKSTEPRKVKRE